MKSELLLGKLPTHFQQTATLRLIRKPGRLGLQKVFQISAACITKSPQWLREYFEDTPIANAPFENNPI